MASSLVLSLGAAVMLAACGDDTEVTALPGDAGSVADATTADVATGADAADAGCVPFDAGTLDPALVAAGHALVTAYKCTKCHGGQLAGNADGVQSPQTEGGVAYPPNLTPDPATGLGCWTNDEIENAFLHGIDDQGSPLCPPMPHFADAGLDASGALEIVEYLRSLPPVTANIPDTPNCSLGPEDDGGDDGSSPVDASDAGDGGGGVDGGDAGEGGAVDAGSDAADSGADGAAVDASDDGG